MSFGNASDIWVKSSFSKLARVVVFSHQQLLPALLLGELFRTQWFSKYLLHAFLLQCVVWWHIKINGRFIGIGHLPHQKISRLPWVGDVLLIIQHLLFKIFWDLLAYHCPTPQRQPHPAHEPFGPSFAGFRTTSRNVQRSGLFNCLLAK